MSKVRVAHSAKGLKASTKFGSQAHTLAKVYRDKGLSVKTKEKEFNADIVEKLAADQTADEDRDTELFNAYQAFHLEFSGREVDRVKQLASALNTARSLLVDDEAALETLKGASFNTGGGKKKVQEPKK